MQTQVKSASGITLVPLEARHLARRRVFLRGEIDMDAACAFSEQILLLNDEAATEPIDVYMASPGGEIQAGLMMYDIIQSSPAPIRMFCPGAAFSMAALLFASGRHGRWMLPHSKLMLHEPLLGSAVRGSASSIKSLSEELMEARRVVNSLLAQHTGRTMEEIEAATGHDHYFTAEESVDFGLADKIVTFGEMMGGV